MDMHIILLNDLWFSDQNIHSQTTDPTLDWEVSVLLSEQ